MSKETEGSIVARERWALRLLARNQDTEQARRAAQWHLERLGALMKSAMMTTTIKTHKG